MPLHTHAARTVQLILTSCVFASRRTWMKKSVQKASSCLVQFLRPNQTRRQCTGLLQVGIPSLLVNHDCFLCWTVLLYQSLPCTRTTHRMVFYDTGSAPGRTQQVGLVPNPTSPPPPSHSIMTCTLYIEYCDLNDHTAMQVLLSLMTKMTL